MLPNKDTQCMCGIMQEGRQVRRTQCEFWGAAWEWGRWKAQGVAWQSSLGRSAIYGILRVEFSSVDVKKGTKENFTQKDTQSFIPSRSL